MSAIARPASGHTGADISGVDLSVPLSDGDLGVIKDALHRWKVVFFRDQSLDHASQIAFARQFGDLTYAHPHDDAPPQEHPEIFTIDPRRYEERYGAGFREAVKKRQYSYFAGWHTDVTAAVNPPAGSILRAETVPEFGGDTQWTNLVAAYEGLSAPVRAFVVVRVHPETGERALFVNPGFTSHLVDVSPRESRAILDLLYEEITRPEYTVRFRWEPGSLAFWDNRATAHLAPRDIEHLDVQRTLHRVTLIGDLPVGPDGRRSELIAGKPFTADHRVVVGA
jgi:taurine dioxygenase